MKLDNFLNGLFLLAFAAVALYSHVAEDHKRVDEPIETVMAKSNPEQKYQAWQLKSIVNSDRLTVVRNGEEIEVSFCGIKAPEKQQELETLARDYLKSLINKGDGNTVYLTPVDTDKSGSMIAELFVYTEVIKTPSFSIPKWLVGATPGMMKNIR
ncbi:MAG: hypothetical protein AAGK10_18670 [Cyanobacteria bacterium J06555_3]